MFSFLDWIQNHRGFACSSHMVVHQAPHRVNALGVRTGPLLYNPVDSFWHEVLQTWGKHIIQIKNSRMAKLLLVHIKEGPCFAVRFEIDTQPRTCKHDGSLFQIGCE